MQEVRRDFPKWKEAVENELKSLFETKGALRKVSPEEIEERKKKGDLDVIPSKLVCTLKPDPTNPRGKRKIRIVACGNFVTAEGADKNELFASGSDAIAVRLAVDEAAKRGWLGRSMDIRTAFLNAPMELDEEVEERKLKEKEEGRAVVEGKDDELRAHRVLVKPPAFLVQMGMAGPNELWEAVRAFYGFREAPRKWSDFRDFTIRRLKIKAKGGVELRLESLISEPNLWKVKEVDTGRMTALLVVYVDDLLVLGEKTALDAVIGTIRGLWETSPPEEVDDEAGVRFLGMELWRLKTGDWMATQRGYTYDLLQRNLGKEEAGWPKKKVPVGREWFTGPEEEEKKIEDVREGQRIVGELMWLVTRCRMDLMFPVSLLASNILKRPREVKQVAAQIWGYLAATIDEGLVFTAKDEEEGLQSFTDASFGEDCQGCSIVKVGGSPIAWKSSRQGAIALSTAEAELGEIVEGLVLGDSIRVVVEEIKEDEEKILRCTALTDNQAATSILADPHGSWRTRYLRMKAKNVRWRIEKADWMVIHVPGAQMPSDMGTKALSAQRFELLKKLAGMAKLPKKEEAKKAEDEAEDEEKKRGEAKTRGVKAKAEEKLKEGAKILQMIVLISQLTQADAQPGSEEKKIGPDWTFLVLLMFAALGLAACIRCLVFFARWLLVRIRLEEAKDRIRARHARDVERQQKKEEEEEKQEEEALRQRVTEARDAEAKAQPKRRPAKAKSKAKGRATPEEAEEDEESRRDREELRQRIEEEEEHRQRIEDMEEARRRAAEVRRPPSQAGSSPPMYPHTPRAPAPQMTPRTAPPMRWPTTPPLPSSMACNLGWGRRSSGSATMQQPLLGGGMMEVELDPEEEPANVIGKGDWMVAKGKAKGGRGDGGGKGKKGGDEMFRPIITPWGTKFHTHRFCPTLANSRTLVMSPWCQHCAPNGGQLRAPVYAMGPGAPAHTDVGCPSCQNSTRRYHVCNMCLEVEES